MMQATPRNELQQENVASNTYTAPQITATKGVQFDTQQNRKIIQNRLALDGEESVSVGHRRQPLPGPIGRTDPCASTSSAMPESHCAASCQGGYQAAAEERWAYDGA